MFKFTIRELLLLTLVVALAAGWIIDNRIKTAKMKSLRWGLQWELDINARLLGHGEGVVLPDGEPVRSSGYHGPILGGAS
jgi:hypothetical protein